MIYSAAQPPSRFPSRATARASAPCVFASLMPSNGLPTSSGQAIPVMEPYARLKGRLRFAVTASALQLHLKRPHNYRTIPHHPAPSRTLTPRSAPAYNPPCNDPT